MTTTRTGWLLQAMTLLALGCGGPPDLDPHGAHPTSDAGVTIEPPADAGQQVADAGLVMPVRYTEDIEPIWRAHCAGCHYYGSQLINLESPGSHGPLLALSTSCFDRDGDRVVAVPAVVPGVPEQSALWIKLQTDLSADPNPPLHCNREMPANGVGLKWLDPAAFALVERWIREGALAD